MTTLAAVALLSCGKEKQQQPEIPAVGFPEDGVVRISASAGDPQTRADGTPEYAGEDLGLFMDYGSGDRFTMDNVRWTNGTSGWTADKQMLWKDSKTAAKLYAYAPYVSGQNDPAKVVFSIPADQSQGTTEADLVTWPKGDFIPDHGKNTEFTEDGKVMISFSHRLVKLTFNFEKGNQYGDDVQVKKATLLGTRSKVLCDATFGKDPVVRETSDAASQDIILHRLGDLKYEAVFFPGKGQEAGASMLKVEMSNGVVLRYAVPTGGLGVSLMPGSAYEMKMRLGKDKIELAKDGITVGNWFEAPTLPGGEAQLNGNSWDGTIATGFEGGNGSGDDPYKIATASQLAYLAEQVNAGTDYTGKSFTLTDNLDLAVRDWTPIGSFNNDKPFRGTFDGGNCTIYGLKVDLTSMYAGLFGAVDGGTVRNLKIEDAEVSASSCAGIICGYAYGNAKISGCEVSGKVTVVYQYAGGVVGRLFGDGDKSIPTLENCKASVKASGQYNIGGLCGGACGSTISGCSIISGGVEGIVKDGSGSVCIGGLVGLVAYTKCTIKDCTVEASVKGRMYVGGLLGDFSAEENHPHSVEKCTMTGTVTVSGEKCGGLAGRLYGKGSFSGCEFDGTIVKDGTAVKETGAAIGLDESEVTFTDCWYNAEKTEGLDVVGTPKEGADYSGIKAKKSGE